MLVLSSLYLILGLLCALGLQHNFRKAGVQFGVIHAVLAVLVGPVLFAFHIFRGFLAWSISGKLE